MLGFGHLALHLTFNRRLLMTILLIIFSQFNFGFFYHDGYWYITWGEAVQNGAGYVYYHCAQNPLGPWHDGGFVTLDGCGAQNKGVNVLPSPQGPVILAGMLGYRTSPSNYVTQDNQWNLGAHVWHADNQQAASSSYFFPIQIDADHRLKNCTRPATIQVPLMDSVEQQPEDPVAYQLDWRVRNWQDVHATFDPPQEGSTLEFPVWQRTDYLASTMNAGPVLDGSLNVIVELLEGQSRSTKNFVYPASNISWAPSIISLDVAGMSVVGVKLSTNATNGYCGTMAQPKAEEGLTYGIIVKGAQGYKKPSSKAQLFVHHF